VQHKKDKILLHACCAPCSTYVLDILSEFYYISVLFYNPNIHPEEEYIKRLREMIMLCKTKKTELIVPDYDDNLWFKRAKGLEDLPEGADRCDVCFDLRLKKTAETAAKKNFKFFTTTLSVSPHKNAQHINSIGCNVAAMYRVQFIMNDFKKKDGYKKSCELSRQYGFYRQNYCGCIYSMGLKNNE
jgi:predicted adenine nucleotide alpha hydrolase (AANH) superfamily ATPase